jgi:hypothetical protein
MMTNKRFKLTRQAMLLATISAAFPISGYAAAGRVDFAIGNVESVAANGIRRPLGKGAEIDAGETISTATGARAQVRFADGGFISLQPNTQFRVDEFKYKNKAESEEKGFFSLLKGGFRAVTGVIGRANKNSYRVKTAAATLGIRGTGYNMVLRDDGLFVSVGEGAISLSNNAGLLVVTAGGAAFVADLNTAPVLTNEQPPTPPTGMHEPTFTVADQRDSSGNLTLFPVLVSGPGYTLAYTYTDTPIVFGATELTNVTAVFSEFSQLVKYDVVSETGEYGTATITSATDGIIGWGRWAGSTIGTGGGPNPLTSAGVFDYVIGIPTAAMPTAGTATYSMIGYTSPTATNGTTGYSVSGALTVDFALVSSQVGVNMSVVDSGSNTYAINGAATIAGSNFTGSISVPMNGTICTGTCTASINGFFAGANASRAGLSYTINDTMVNNHIQGVAAFAKD